MITPSEHCVIACIANRAKHGNKIAANMTLSILLKDILEMSSHTAESMATPSESECLQAAHILYGIVTA